MMFGRLETWMPALLAVTIAFSVGAGARADDRSDAQEIVDHATRAVEAFRSGGGRETVDALLARPRA